MPAKKKQTKQSATAAAATGGADSSEVDQIAKLAAEINSEMTGTLTTKEKKQQDKEMKKMFEAYQQQQQQYIRQQIIQQQLQQHAVDQEHAVANRTQNPVTGFELEKSQTTWTELAPGKWIRYQQFTPEYMESLMQLFSDELPEPYSAFTYEHFLSGWPVLGIMLFGFEGEKAPETESAGGKLIGSCVSKVSWKYPQNHFRGYIAMLAVRPEWRGHRLGQRLVKVSVEMMKRMKAQEVVLETPVGNERALKLYTQMGFAKTKFLTRYYLDGSDAIRLKLWFSPPRM